MKSTSYQQQTRDLINGLKAVCASNGLGNPLLMNGRVRVA